MGPIGFPETSVRNHHYSLRNDPEERSSQLLRGGSLKYLIKQFYFFAQIVPPKTPIVSVFYFGSLYSLSVIESVCL
jgi:hypothetical protein